MGRKEQIQYQLPQRLKRIYGFYPPRFKISNKCCHYAKKMVAQKCVNEGGYDLNITGVRKAEGGVRSTAYKNCFTPETENAIAQYRPIFWYDSNTKATFEQMYGIKHSDCYELWGLKRTGCSGCPYALNLENELEAVEKYEPKLYKALTNVFGESYEYTRKYHNFREIMKNNEHKKLSDGETDRLDEVTHDQ